MLLSNGSLTQSNLVGKSAVLPFDVMESSNVMDHQVCVVSMQCTTPLFSRPSGWSDTDALQTHYALLEDVRLLYITTLSLSVVNLVSFCRTFLDIMKRSCGDFLLRFVV